MMSAALAPFSTKWSLMLLPEMLLSLARNRMLESPADPPLYRCRAESLRLRPTHKPSHSQIEE